MEKKYLFSKCKSCLFTHTLYIRCNCSRVSPSERPAWCGSGELAPLPSQHAHASLGGHFWPISPSVGHSDVEES